MFRTGLEAFDGWGGLSSSSRVESRQSVREMEGKISVFLSVKERSVIGIRFKSVWFRRQDRAFMQTGCWAFGGEEKARYVSMFRDHNSDFNCKLFFREP
jgi:hypothetical protein